MKSHLPSPSCITACDRMHSENIESGAERRRRCVCSHVDSMSFSAATCHYPTRLARLWAREVHLVNIECEIRIQSSASVVNILFPPSTHPDLIWCMLRCLQGRCVLVNMPVFACSCSAREVLEGLAINLWSFCWKADLDCRLWVTHCLSRSVALTPNWPLRCLFVWKELPWPPSNMLSLWWRTQLVNGPTMVLINLIAWFD